MNKMCHLVVILKTAITWRKHNQSINQSGNQKIWLLPSGTDQPMFQTFVNEFVNADCLVGV